MITVNGLSFRFQGSPHKALDDITLHINKGDFVVITGASGCGKSTLALALGGYLFKQYAGETTGTVSVAGMAVQQVPIYDIAEVVGLVQQDPEAQFCTLTVRDEIAFGLENRRLPREEIQSRMVWALGVVGAEYLIERDLATLSGGEKQKVAIAALLAARPQVLIFDEPTSNLDPSATAEIFEVISRIQTASESTVIVIEHKVNYLRVFNPHLVTMEAGRIIYNGPLQAAITLTPKPVPPIKPMPRTSTESLVQVKALHIAYNGTPVLRGISLDIQPGEFVAIMGNNGSGKTTFLRSLLGLVKPSQGSVRVLGHDTLTAAVSEMARDVGYVFQNPNHQLFTNNVWEEATFAPRNFGTLSEAELVLIKELLDNSGLGGRENDHPYKLSYGEKRRLNLISVLTYHPQLVLLDEVLIGQDGANAAYLLELLYNVVRGGGSVVMINHNPDITYHYASRVLFMDHGQIVVDAPPAKAFRQLSNMGWHVYQPTDEGLRSRN